jgi:hypothetical protein
MGLDMYLTAKRYLWSDKDKEISEKINELVGVKGDMENRWNGSSMIVKEISIDAMYWRKANAIHNWFVCNIQGGEDDCKEYQVNRGHLEELLSYCRQALETKDPEILEPKGGFFFGSTEIDQYYWDDIQATAQGLERALTLPEKEYEFYYQASW